MRRVGVKPFATVSPATWTVGVIVAVLWIAGTLAVADRIASTEAPSVRQSVMTLPEPGQTSNRAAKAAREPFGPEAFKQARVAPDIVSPKPEIVTPIPEEADDAQEPDVETGRASWYDLEAKTASGETMDGDELTAAHPSLPFGSKVRVENLRNGRSVVVRINDRGPFTKGRIIDVSRAAAEQLGMIGAGVARVSVQQLDDEVAGSAVASN